MSHILLYRFVLGIPDASAFGKCGDLDAAFRVAKNIFFNKILTEHSVSAPIAVSHLFSAPTLHNPPPLVFQKAAWNSTTREN